MIKYQITIDYHTSVIINVEDETTDYGALIDMAIDKFENEGSEGYFIDFSDTVDGGGDIQEDMYICGGNHSRYLYHGGLLDIRPI